MHGRDATTVADQTHHRFARSLDKYYPQSYRNRRAWALGHRLGTSQLAFRHHVGPRRSVLACDGSTRSHVALGVQMRPLLLQQARIERGQFSMDVLVTPWRVRPHPYAPGH